MMGEHIRSAAVSVSSKVFSGKNHSECLKKLKLHTIQGFIADCYEGSRFVGRIEALQIAKAAHQTIHKHNPKDQLLSEDLKDDKLFNR